MDLEDGATSPKTESENYVHVDVEMIVFILVIVLSWIIWTFYNTLSFLVHRLSRGKQINVLASSSSYPTVSFSSPSHSSVRAITDVVWVKCQIQIKQFFALIVLILAIVLSWIICTFYNTFSFLVHRLSRGKQINVLSSSSSYPTVSFSSPSHSSVRAITDVVLVKWKIQVKQLFEVLVLSLYLLVCISLLMSKSESYFKHFGKHVSPSKTNLTEATTQQLTADNVGQVFRNNTRYFETTAIDLMYVYSCPLTAPFSSSTTSFRNAFQRQYLPVDYHAFIVFHTRNSISVKWWSLEKQREGVFLSWGMNKDWVTHFFKGKARAKPIQMLTGEFTNSTVSDLARRLRKILKSNEYDLIEKNCQHFSKEIFDNTATDEIWEFTTLIDMTSPLSWAKNGFGRYVIVISMAIFYELYLLFIKSRENESFHFQYIVYVVTLVSLFLMFFNDKLSFMLVYHLCVDLFFELVLPLEAVLYAPLYTIRKRGAQYRKMCRSGNVFYKCWLSMCFGAVYTVTTYLILVCIPLIKVERRTSPDQSKYKLYLGNLFYYLTSLDFAIPPLHSIASCLFNILGNHHINILILSSVVLTGFYLNLQDLTDDTRKIFVSNNRPSTRLTRRASW